MSYNFAKGITTLAVAILITSSLPSALLQKDNIAMDNAMLKDITLLNKMNSTAAGTGQSASLLAGLFILHIGKGLNGGFIGITGDSTGNIASTFKSIRYQNSIPELLLGNPAKPMKDLEKVVFVCNIL